MEDSPSDDRLTMSQEQRDETEREREKEGYTGNEPGSSDK